MACIIVLQTSFPKAKSVNEEGYDDDHGYLPPIEDDHVDNIFATWWNPVLNKEEDVTAHTNKVSDDGDEEGYTERNLRKDDGEVKEA